MFVIDVPYFNLDQIYNSGQVPRWIKLKEGKYIIPFKDRALKIEQKRDRFDFNKYRLIISCSEEDFYNIWFEYFDLRTDCLDVNMKVKRLGGKFKVPANRGSGIHIIHQDEFEAYVLAKLITFVGYRKAGELMNRIAQTYGIEHKQRMREAGRVVWYEWPTPETMLEKLNKEKINSDNKVKKFLKKLCEAIINDGYDYTCSDNELFKLFGKHDMSQFPMTRIEDIITKNFKENPEEFVDWYLSDIEEKGIVYMYIVHYILNRLKEVK